MGLVGQIIFQTAADRLSSFPIRTVLDRVLCILLEIRRIDWSNRHSGHVHDYGT
jgi:hypothetical protein